MPLPSGLQPPEHRPDARYKEFSNDAQLNELAGDGYYDFFHAFRANEIDYERFYKTRRLRMA